MASSLSNLTFLFRRGVAPRPLMALLDPPGPGNLTPLLNLTHRLAYRTSTVGGGGGSGGEGEGEAGSCGDWQEAQHTLFQLANLCVVVSFLTPPSFRFHLLFLRAMLLLGYLLHVLWAGLFICMADLLAWNLLFFALNTAHLAALLYRHLPSKLPASHLPLYTKVFRPMRVSEAEFLQLCSRGRVLTLGAGRLYAVEGLTPCGHRLSVLITGRLKVTYRRLFLHHVEHNQFVDGVEYDVMPALKDPASKYQVTIAACEDSLVLTWDMATLQDLTTKQPFLGTALHYLIGKDVCSHLYAIQEQLLRAPDYMSTLASRQSSMVNVRSCLAAHDSSSSISHMADLTGYRVTPEAESTSTTHLPSTTTVETSV